MAEAASKPAEKSRKRLILIAAAMLALAAGGAWYSGILGHLLGHTPPKQTAAAPPSPTFVDLPDIVANLDAGGRRPVFVKLKAKLELARPQDTTALAAAMPRVLDLFQTYLRETRPDELRGSAGTYRLREELINRASLAATPARVTDVLFTEILVQ